MLFRMERAAYSGLASRRDRRSLSPPDIIPNVVPFGPLGGGQWTGHPIGLLIVLGFVLIALAGVPESRLFFVASLGLSAILGPGLYLWHRSRSFF